MFIGVCLECYDGKQGVIVKINRVDEDDPICSTCGKPMYLVYTKHSSSSRGDYEHISESLAINPCQEKAHRKLFPDVDVLADGRIRFTSVRSQSKYLQQTGFVKVPQKIRRSTSIATG